MLFLQKTSVKHINVILFSYSHIQSLLFVVWSLVLAEGQQEGKKFEFSCRISFDYIVLKHVNSVYFFLIFFQRKTLSHLVSQANFLVWSTDPILSQEHLFTVPWIVVFFTCTDYYRLRVGGLILAAVLCLIGITILLSKFVIHIFHLKEIS